MSTTQPPSRPDGSPIDTAAVRRKYIEERDKRLRPDGSAQYTRLTEQFTQHREDPYNARTEREPVTRDCTVALIGGGFAGLVTGARLRQAGIRDVRIIDKAGDFGGTWYWNRYPGAQCDTASMVYMPLLEETGHIPTEKYAHGPEILEHCRRIGRHFELYPDALFHTTVTDLRWDPSRSRWVLHTDRGDHFAARFVAMGTGPLHVAKLPGIPGLDSFTGHSFHTSRWDYAYTGGDPSGAPLDRLAEKRVAIIGTGATAVQCVPHLARACRELFVIQRTPSSVDVRDNHPIDAEWFAQVATPGWQRRWLENFTDNQTRGESGVDLVMDGWTEIARRVRAKVSALPPRDRTPTAMLAAFEDSDYEKMEAIRARVDTVVEDPGTADALKAWYRQLCKRPCFHDTYLQTFNRPNTHLVDTDGRGVQEITENGVVVAGVEYPVDCIIYASGFEVGTDYTRRAGYDITGRGGLRLSDYWARGMRTLHGIHVRNFPNAFLVQPLQGANLISNFPHNLTESGQTVATVIKYALDHGCDEVEVSQEAEDSWVERLRQPSNQMAHPPDCTPGYYNNEGHQGRPGAQLDVGDPAGPMAFFRHLERWRSDGRFDGLRFRPSRRSAGRNERSADRARAH